MDFFAGRRAGVARAALLREIVSRVKVKRAREVEVERSARELAKKPAPARVDAADEANEDGRMQSCVFATCLRSETGYTVGPVWGTSERSVKRALCTLTEECDCRARFHEETDSEE